MSKITLVDDSSFELLSADLTEEYYNKCNRSCLTFRFDPKKYALNDLNLTFTDISKTSKIVITDNDKSYEYNNYTNRIRLSLQSTLVNTDGDGNYIYNDVLSVTLAQKTTEELEIMRLKEELLKLKAQQSE